MKWLSRILISLVVMLLAAVLLLLIFISPVAEWAIEKYSKEYIGRQMTMDKLSINLLIGRLNIDNLEVSEAGDATGNWLQCDNIRGAIDVPKLFTGKYELQYAIVDGLKTAVLQDGGKFNFDDLMALPEKFAKGKKEVEEATDPVDWSIQYVILMNSQLRYANHDYDVDYTASNLLIYSPIISSTVPRMDFKYSFDISSGGHLKGAYSINTDDLKYGLHFTCDKLNLSETYPYVRDFIAINKLDAMLDSDLYLFGNHRNAAYFYTDGSLALYDVNVVDSLGQSIAALRRFDVQMDSVEAHTKYYEFGDITLTDPFIKFERYTEGDNWTRLMRVAQSESTVSKEEASYSNPFVIIANYLREYIKDYIVSDYYADHIAMRGGSVHFDDYTLHDKFKAKMDAMNMDIDRLNTDNDRLRMSFSSKLNESANFDLNVAINPKDFQDMEMDFNLHDFNMSIINPYMVYYVAAPFTEGVMQFDNSTNITGGYIKVDNKITIDGPRIGKKQKNSTAMNNLPVKLAVGMLKDPHGNIVLDIPVEGDLKDPNYKLGPTIWNIVKNLIIKAAQAPVKGLISLFGDKEENLQNIVISYGLPELMPDQVRALKRMAEPLRINDALVVTYSQWIDVQEEINTMITLDARKQYAMEKDLLSKKEKKTDISLYQALLKISVNDSLFVEWLDAKAGTKGVVESPVDKCARIVNVKAITALQKQYAAAREKQLMDIMLDRIDEEERVRINPMDLKTFPPGDVPRFVYDVKALEEEEE
jgi:hypothetical protein